jgi:hypothetical protein
MESGGSLPNDAGSDTADHMEVGDLPTATLHSTANDLQHAEAESEGGAGVTLTVIEGADSDTAAKKSNDVTPTAITPAHSDRAAWPDWMRKYVAHVEAAASSDDFKLLVQQYIKLETLLGFPKGQVRTVIGL